MGREAEATPGDELGGPARSDQAAPPSSEWLAGSLREAAAAAKASPEGPGEVRHGLTPPPPLCLGSSQGRPCLGLSPEEGGALTDWGLSSRAHPGGLPGGWPPQRAFAGVLS